MYHITSLTAFDRPKATTIAEIVERITTSAVIKATVSRARKATDPESLRAIKLTLPAFVLGEFKERITNKDFIKSDYLLFDIDHIDEDKINKVRERVERVAYFAFLSPSGSGIKFAIRMSTAVMPDNFRSNYEHYADFFSDLLGVDLDRQTKDPSRKCYYSHDPKCFLNPNVTAYPVLDAKTVQKAENVDIRQVGNEEIRDVCNHLKYTRLSYAEWTIAAMALQCVDNGFELFKSLSVNEYYPNETEDNIRIQWEQCHAVNNITLGSLFWMAMQKGYRRKNKYMAETPGLYPFIIEKDGSYYRDKNDNFIWVFGWKQIEYLYDIREIRTKDGRDDDGISVMDGGNELVTCLRIDGKEVRIPAQSMTTGSLLKREIAKQLSMHFTQKNSDTYFNMLSEYLHRTKTGAEVKLVRGIGRILPNLWNWGNYVILDREIYDYEQIIWTSEKSGYMVEPYNNVQITVNRDQKDKLKRMFYFYNNQLAIALGWAVANLYFAEIMDNYGGFPILFLHGDTGKGKTKLGNLLLAMFGVTHPDADKTFRATLENMSTVAGTRLKSNIYCMPTFFDEYNGGHYHLLKGLYDGSGRTTALKDQTNRVKRSDVFGGTITASLIRPHEKEVLNRCIYFNVMKSVDDTKADAFNRELMRPESYRELSDIMINVAVRNLGEEYLAKVVSAHSMLMAQCKKTNEAIGRISANYAIAYAGYRLLVDHKVIDEWATDQDWIDWANETVDAIHEADPVESFVSLISQIASRNQLTRVLRSEVTYLDRAEATQYTVFLKEVWPEVQRICRDGKMYPDLVGMSVSDMASKLRNSSYCLDKPRIKRFWNDQFNPSEGVGTAYVLVVPTDEDTEKQSDIPF